MLVHHFLENSAKRLPDKVALICGNQKLTYGEVNHLAERVASALMDAKINRQDRIVIFLDNSVEAIVALFGILKAGCIFVMLNATMKDKKLNYTLKDSGARAIITHKNKSRIVNKAIKGTTELEHIIWCGGNSESGDIQVDVDDTSIKTSVSWAQFTGRTANPAPKAEYPRTIDVDIATIIYTSGSTGEPKGIISTHYNVVAAATSITTYLENVEDDIIINVLPLSFDYGLYQVLMAFLFGGTVVLEKSFVYPYKIIEKLVKERVTGFPIVPTMAAILFQMENISDFDFSSLRYITNTAAALPVTFIRKLQRIFPDAKIFSMYGLTECKRVSYLPPEYIDTKPESVGVPIPNSEVFVVDGNGKELGPGETGELVIRGSNVMQGYWNSPEETARTFRTGRYGKEVILYSGDLFKKDEDGFLYFVSRKDDMIKTKGERVSPKEIENVLYEMDGVSEAAVIGVPDDIFGSAIKLFVVPKKNDGLTERQVMAFCKENLEPFMVPKYIEIRNALPKSNSGKIDKKKLN